MLWIEAFFVDVTIAVECFNNLEVLDDLGSSFFIVLIVDPVDCFVPFSVLLDLKNQRVLCQTIWAIFLI